MKSDLEKAATIQASSGALWVDHLEFLVVQYQKELCLKRDILGDLCNLNKDTLLLYLAAWKMQPYITAAQQERLEPLEPI